MNWFSLALAQWKQLSMASRNIRLGLSFNNRMENSRGGKVSILCFSLFFFFFPYKRSYCPSGFFCYWRDFWTPCLLEPAGVSPETCACRLKPCFRNVLPRFCVSTQRLIWMLSLQRPHHNSKEPAAVFGKPVQEKQSSRISGTSSPLRWVKPGAAYVMNHQVICSLA